MLETIKATVPIPNARAFQRVTTALAWLVILAMIAWVLAPTMADPSAIGSHDWDQMESHRYLVVKTIRRFHQFPFWNPYACGGHPNWGGVESATTLVSPWLPFYLSMTLPHAMRVEVWGSALLSALGAWLLAGRFTSSAAARALVVVAFAVNGRWALQLATGHTWHLAYAWTPWALYFYDRALGVDPMQGRPRRRDVVLCAACLAFMVYTGGIYPLPQTVVAIALYGTAVAALQRSYRPVLLGLAAGVLAFGLAAPKLLPLLDVLAKYPRLIPSTESIDLGALVQILTAQDQDVGAHPANVNAPWGWHEFGMYVGWPVVVAISIGALFGRGTREVTLKWVGIFFFVLAFGAFDPHAPWPLLHQWSIFKSQHVPSRWQYPGLLLLLTVTAALLERALRRSSAARAWLEIALLAAVAWIAHDVGSVARQPITHTFATQMPTTPESTGPFHTEIHLPPELAYMVNYDELSLSAEIANIGTTDCVTFPGLNSFVRDSKGRARGMGAHGRGDTDYKGEVYVADGVGDASMERWTPNQMTVTVHGGKPGEYVVLNQNWDDGWRANGSRATNWSDQVAAQLHGGDEAIVFRYRPRLWWAGVLTFIMTAGAIGYASWLVRKRERRRARR
jgi:hypothetical protein